jgi:hypothetical protein
MAEETPQVASVPRFRTFVDSSAVRRRWLFGLVVVTIVILAFATIGAGRKLESWTATTTILIGTSPTLAGVLNSSDTPIALAESARDLVMRIEVPQFRAAVMAGAQKELKDSKASLTGATLRGIVIGDATIRLETTAASKEEAVVLLRHAILAVQNAHRELVEPRIELLRAVRLTLQKATNMLDSSLKGANLDPLQAPSAVNAPAADAPPGPRNLLDRLVDFETRIAALNYIERTVSPTEPEGGFQPSIDGPREANLVQRCLLAGLGVLLFGAVLTFSLASSARRA